MGNPMAYNLINSGYSVTVYDLDKAKAQNLIDSGAKFASDLEESVKDAHLIMTSLPGPAQVREVILGENGILNFAQKDRYYH